MYSHLLRCLISGEVNLHTIIVTYKAYISCFRSNQNVKGQHRQMEGPLGIPDDQQVDWILQILVCNKTKLEMQPDIGISFFCVQY